MGTKVTDLNTLRDKTSYNKSEMESVAMQIAAYTSDFESIIADLTKNIEAMRANWVTSDPAVVKEYEDFKAKCDTYKVRFDEGCDYMRVLKQIVEKQIVSYEDAESTISRKIGGMF